MQQHLNPGATNFGSIQALPQLCHRKRELLAIKHCACVGKPGAVLETTALAHVGDPEKLTLLTKAVAVLMHPDFDRAREKEMLGPPGFDLHDDHIPVGDRAAQGEYHLGQSSAQQVGQLENVAMFPAHIGDELIGIGVALIGLGGFRQDQAQVAVRPRNRVKPGGDAGAKGHLGNGFAPIAVDPIQPIDAIGPISAIRTVGPVGPL